MLEENINQPVVIFNTFYVFNFGLYRHRVATEFFFIEKLVLILFLFGNGSSCSAFSQGRLLCLLPIKTLLERD